MNIGIICSCLIAYCTVCFACQSRKDCGYIDIPKSDGTRTRIYTEFCCPNGKCSSDVDTCYQIPTYRPPQTWLRQTWPTQPPYTANHWNQNQRITRPVKSDSGPSLVTPIIVTLVVITAIAITCLKLVLTCNSRRNSRPNTSPRPQQIFEIPGNGVVRYSSNGVTIGMATPRVNEVSPSCEEVVSHEREAPLSAYDNATVGIVTPDEDSPPSYHEVTTNLAADVRYPASDDDGLPSYEEATSTETEYRTLAYDNSMVTLTDEDCPPSYQEIASSTNNDVMQAQSGDISPPSHHDVTQANADRSFQNEQRPRYEEVV